MPRSRIDVLNTSKKLTAGDRDKSYGSPVKNMQETAEGWRWYIKTYHGIDVPLNGENVAKMMSILKTARTGASYKEDNYDDATTYEAIAGECADHERGPI